MKSNVLLLGVLTALLITAGCNDMVGLRGTITYSDTGDPVTQGEVHFSTDTFFSRASIDKNGNYSACTYKEGDGLPPGTYRVAIVSCAEGGDVTVGKNGLTSGDTMKWFVDKKFASPATSGLTATVDKSTRKIDFKVERPQK